MDFKFRLPFSVVLAVLLLPLALRVPAWASPDHGHDHGHGHSHGDEDATTLSPSALDDLLLHYQGEIQDTREKLRRGEVTLEDYRHLQTHHAQLLRAITIEQLTREADLEHLARTGVYRAPGLSLRAATALGNWVQHNVMHLNPVFLGKRILKQAQRYGALFAVGVGLGIAATESSEWIAWAFAATNATDSPFLAFLASIYGGLHLGEAAGMWVATTIPEYLHKGVVTSRLLWHAGGPARLRQSLQRLRREMPVDWTLDPYFFSGSLEGATSSPQEFLVLDLKSGWNLLPRALRPLSAVRRDLQARAFPTLDLKDLVKVARTLGLHLPSADTPFHQRTGQLLESLRASGPGRLALQGLLRDAQARVTAAATTPATPTTAQALPFPDFLKICLEAQGDRAKLRQVLVGLGLSPLALGEHLRLALLSTLESLPALENQARFREQHQALRHMASRLRHMVEVLERPTESVIRRLQNEDLPRVERLPLSFESVVRTTEEAAEILRVLHNPEALMETLETLGTRGDLSLLGYFYGSTYTHSGHFHDADFDQANQRLDLLRWAVYSHLSPLQAQMQLMTRELGTPSRHFRDLRFKIRTLRTALQALEDMIVNQPPLLRRVSPSAVHEALRSLLVEMATLEGDCESQLLETEHDGDGHGDDQGPDHHHDHHH